MQTKRKINALPLIVYLLFFFLTLGVLTYHASMGMHIPAFWGRGYDTISLNTSMINGVEITSFKCPKFMDEKEGGLISVSIKNKDYRKQTAGAILIVSKAGVPYNQFKTAQRTRLETGEEQSFSWKIDSSNLVDKRVSVRLSVAMSPDHPSHSARGCVVLPWKGPFSAKFMNTWAYPLFVLLFILSAVWCYFKSNLNWENKKRFFFFLFANVIVLVMFFFLMPRLYLVALVALPFLFIGLVATIQTSPYIPVDEYRNYLDS